MEISTDLDISEPYFDEETTPDPPTYGTIDQYNIQKSLLDNPTKCSYVYTCTDVYDERVKVIKFIKCYEGKLERVINEIETMRIVNHPNIIRMEKYFRYGAFYCVILPYTNHRSLLWLLVQHYNDGLPEEAASSMMHQMLESVKYLHDHHIWHRDIKPDNFLLFDSDTSNPENNELSIPKSFHGIPKVVLSDFGFAKSFMPGEKCDKYMGTVEFLAPEMINQVPYDNSVDIWSLGVTLFTMITGRFPFYRKECKRKIARGELNFKLLSDMDKSDEVQDLIAKMCAFKPEDRITAEDALKHPWILSQMKTPAENEIANEIGPENEFIFNPGT